MHRLILALILLAGLALRIWNIDYGLPFVYSVDEGYHFTNRAVEMFWQDFDPGYYQNPATYTYLVYGLLRVMYGPLGFVFDLPFSNVTEQFAKDPTQIWIAARTLAAVLGIVGVLATYWAARRLWGIREGLVAAALMSFAFLPVAYSRVAVTDVGALTGVALALLFAVRAGEEGRTRDYALAGAAAGLAISFKYTAGLVLLPLGIAALARLRADRLRAVGGVALGGALAALVFVLLNPYLFGSLDQWWTDLRDQADVAANDAKAGQESGGVRLLPRQPHLGPRLGRPRRGAGGRRPRAPARAGARAHTDRPAARAVRLPGDAVALLRALAAARLSGARAARRGRGGRARRTSSHARSGMPGGARCGRSPPARCSRRSPRSCCCSRSRPTCAAPRCWAARTP